MMEDVEAIVRDLRPEDAYVVAVAGYAFGNSQFMASVMRPLERRGLFMRETRNGFRVRWNLTDAGQSVRTYLLSQTKE